MSISVFVEHMSSEMNTTSPPDKRVVLIVFENRKKTERYEWSISASQLNKIMYIQVTRMAHFYN